MSELNILTDVGWASVWLLGLSVGMTTCTAVCMPYLGTWALGRAQGGGSAYVDTLAFATGKVMAYATLGGIAGWLGEFVLSLLEGGVGHYMIGAASIGAGIYLLMPGRRHAPCMALRNQGRLSPLMMGYALSFTPCAPLAALVAASATTGDTLLGIGYGVAFGLGAALTPLFLVIPLLGVFGSKLKEGRPWLGKWMIWLGASVLIAIGINRMIISA